MEKMNILLGLGVFIVRNYSVGLRTVRELGVFYRMRGHKEPSMWNAPQRWLRKID